MKKVIIADKHPLFREFLKQKLAEEQIEVILTQENRDTYPRMVSTLPNLIIMDMEDDNFEEMAFLERKASDFNTVGIPVIITGPTQDKANIAALAKFGVIKYFAKPIQFDIFFESIGKVLNIPLSMDSTPCVLDLHRNGSVIFVELALGLNRDKIALLQYKLSEMIEKEMIENPKIVVMLTNLDLTFVDGYNLEFLMDNILSCSKINSKNIKVLSFSPFLKEFLVGHPDYSEVEMADNLQVVLNSLVDTTITSSVSDLITDKILTNSNEALPDLGSIETRFSSDVKRDDENKDEGTVLNIAIVDSDEKYAEETKSVFTSIGANCTVFEDGQSFFTNYKDDEFDLIILDVLIKDKTGLSLLQRLQEKRKAPPIMVYSQSVPKETLVRILSSGAKGYLVKPQKSNVLVQKSLALLKGAN